MAYMRSLVTRSSLVRRKYLPSVGYILHDNDRKDNVVDEDPSGHGLRNVSQRKSFSSSFNNSSSIGGFGNLAAFHFSGNGRCAEFFPSSSGGVSFSRRMSTTVGGGTENVDMIHDIADVLNDGTVQTVATQVPVANEVAIAAADSFFPIAALQHFIGAVHSYTGLEWWSSIILTTLIIRGVMIPLSINILKSTSKLTLLRPRLEEIKAEMDAQGKNPVAMLEGQAKIKKLFKEYGVSPFSPMKGIFLQGPVFISFFLALSNMVEKVPSFKNGGALWFVDLTTPDALYALPVLSALAFLITAECNMQQGMEGNPIAGTMKTFMRVLAVASVPLTMSFPKAIFFYWITSSVFSLAYGSALKIPALKKSLGIPEIPIPPPDSAKKSPFSLFSVLKEAAAKQASSQSVSSPPAQASSEQVSSSVALSQRIKSLERQVNGRKRNRKR